MGIHRSFLPHVFERFRQADGSTTREHGGLGLGLAIVRHIVELHGGTVAAESEGPGTGATFIVELPQLNAGPAVAAETVTRKRLSDGQPLAGCRVLVLEDEEDARRLLEAALSRAGATVRGTMSADAAIHMLSEDPADVVLADIGLPGKDGYAFIHELRASEGSEFHVPCAAVTAYARPEDRENLMAAGFDAHVSKPVDPRSIIETVAALWAAGAERVK